MFARAFVLPLLIGLLSAFAFQPVGLWPLMPIAFAVLCELISRAPSLRRALLIGWTFGLGQFVLGLNWIATAFTYQAAMPAWLGWVAVVVLSLVVLGAVLFGLLGARQRLVRELEAAERDVRPFLEQAQATAARAAALAEERRSNEG